MNIELVGDINGEFLEETQHYCTSHLDGDVIVWKCPICSDPINVNYTGYLRTYNWKTGEMSIQGPSIYLHSGTYEPGSVNNIVMPLTKNLGEN